MEHLQTQAEWEEQMMEEILQAVQGQLYLSYRYLGPALSALPAAAHSEVNGMGTDGSRLLVQPSRTLRIYRSNPVLLHRDMLHQLFHCLLRHPFLRGNRQAELWDLACDIAVESILDALDAPCVRRAVGWLRGQTYAAVRQTVPLMAAGPIYRALAGHEWTVEQWEKLNREFRADDHRFWPQMGPKNATAAQADQQWQKLSRQVQTQMQQSSSQAGQGDGALAMQVQAANRSRRTYKDFLRSFAVLREEMHADPDSFDVNLYTYGLSLYGNLPLLEPLESRESVKVEQLVIVVDTSLSCSGALVKSFLRETYALLRQSESFFGRTNIRVLQCDDGVRSDQKITCQQELQAYMDHFELVGGGGTDFRPAFHYVDQLRAAGELPRLKGLLYFTDGLGCFPAKAPPYKAAFLFVGQPGPDAQLPPWAIQLVLEEEEFLPTEPKTTGLPGLSGSTED